MYMIRFIILPIITDAPLDARNLKRLAKRGIMGMAKTGGMASNGIGDYVIACLTEKENLIEFSDSNLFHQNSVLRNDAMTPLFMAAIEATEEAIINSLFAAETMTGRDGLEVKAIPVQQIMKFMEK
jgi:D-aminopeptidase